MSSSTLSSPVRQPEEGKENGVVEDEPTTETAYSKFSSTVEQTITSQDGPRTNRRRRKAYGCQTGGETSASNNNSKDDDHHQPSTDHVAESLGIAFPTTQEFDDDYDIGEAKSSSLLFSDPVEQEEEKVLLSSSPKEKDDESSDEEQEATFEDEEDHVPTLSLNQTRGRTKKLFGSSKEDMNHNNGLDKGDKAQEPQQEVPEDNTTDIDAEKDQEEKESSDDIAKTTTGHEEEDNLVGENDDRSSKQGKNEFSVSSEMERSSNTTTTTTTTTVQDKPSPENPNEEQQSQEQVKEEVEKEELLDEESLTNATDRLFVDCDTDSMTVGDIIRSLEIQFDMTMSKPLKKIVRNRLKALIRGEVKPMVDNSNDDENTTTTKEDTASNISSSSSEGEEEEQENEDEVEESSSEEEGEEDVSDYEEEDVKPKRRKRTRRPTNEKKKQVSFSKRPSSKKNPKPKAESRRTTRSTSGGKKKASAVRIHAEMLRKKRIEELRVRNEELQLAQSKQDQERAEKIAQKFETDTDDLQRKRLEDRLDLLSKLDQKRIQVISIQDDEDDDGEETANDNNITGTNTHENDELPSSKDNPTSSIKATSETRKKVPESPPSVARTDGSSEEEEGESSDDDDGMELEILGGSNKFIPSIANRTTVVQFLSTSTANATTKPERSNALSILDHADKSQKGGHHHTQKSSSSSPTKKDIFSYTKSKNAQKATSSPGKSINARRALREALQSKQRKAGNMWLARELGYKTEEEHLRDCRLAEQQKREKIIKLEAERLKNNERKQLRERLLLEGSEEIPSEEQEEDSEENQTGDEDMDTNDQEEEMDEEMAMAKEIEKEQDEEKESGDSSSFTGENEIENDSLQEELDVSDEAEDVISREDKNCDLSAEPENNKAKESEQDGAVLNAKKYHDNEIHVESGNLDKDEQNVGGATSADIPKSAKDSSAESDNDKAADIALIDTSKGEAADVGMIDSLDDEKSSASQEEENEFKDEVLPEQNNKPRNAAWQAMLKKEAEQLKKAKMNKGGSKLVDAEADEEEEEFVMGLEDFGFSHHKKKKDDDEEEEDGADKLAEDDLENIVDDVSDNEGDEEAGEEARKELERKEEKERHKEMLRRMREGYDGRRGGIAGGGVGARGMHRFDQLVAADNREEGKRLGLANDDEFDSENEGETESKNGDDDNNGEIEDETALLDKMLKDRFLHRSSVELEENFSEDEDEDAENETETDAAVNKMDEDEKEQERLAKQFAKRARMQRLLETYGEDEEFTQSRLIDEDESMKTELRRMKNVMVRSKRQTSMSSSRSCLSSGYDSQSNDIPDDSSKKSGRETNYFGSGFSTGNGKLSLALKASKRSKKKTSFLGGNCRSGKEGGVSILKSVALNHVVFHTGDASQNSQPSKSSVPFASSRKSTNIGKRKRTTLNTSTSLWSKVSANSFKKRR